ncbi:TetR/AcrR family transcriptional regulator [Streptomyces avicenniae]|uniref:TetR/AcrR family transcriptional regulator n=1 Tax=Streptomyces avicenniae TaxID=500153 RepID=UPI00069A7E44|nr:TetR family transcriptional regulator [Streptomyces avicenniae]
MPTGVALRDARQQLFDAAERVLLRDGPHALTSRAVTAEAGCAKGVLHRHFADFDAFLAALVADRAAARVEAAATALRDRAGTGTVEDNLADALVGFFGPVTVALVALITFRDDLRARLRADTPRGIPVLTEATTALAAYLAAERAGGRVVPGAAVDVLAPTLIGAAHLLYADRTGAPPTPADVHRTVTTVVTGALPAAP